MLSLATRARNVAGDAIVDLIDGGTGGDMGYMEIRDGEKPSSPQVAAPGVLLATLPMSNPAFGDFVNGRSQANDITSDTDIAENGIAGWFRVYDRDGLAVLDGTITVIGEGGDIEFESINFIRGGTVILDGLEAIMPQ